MLVVKWYDTTDIRIQEMSKPSPGRHEMLVKVKACGICGSDVVGWYRRPRAPLVPGHEIGAEVVEVGAEVADYRPGDRVFVAPKVPCLECRYCRDGHHAVCPKVPERLPGGLAEYVLVPRPIVARGTYRLTAAISDDEATFIEPLACAIRAQRLAALRAGQTVAILGCGVSGLLQIKLAKAAPCWVLATDVARRRLELAAKYGADIVAEAEQDVAARLVAAMGRKADVVIVCTAAATAVEQAFACVDSGGAVVFFAVPAPDQPVTIPLSEFWTREIRILTSYYCGPADIVTAIELLQTGKINVSNMITHRLALSDAARGFQLVHEGNESLKVIIRPQQG
jgi:L-iditol 2-dehydrogenase